MIAEIRSFVTCLRTEGFAFLGDDIDNSSDEAKMEVKSKLVKTLQSVSDMGMTIITPLLRPSFYDINMDSLVRRKNSFFLPLELFPAIIATADILDDSLAQIRVKMMVTDERTVGVNGISRHAMLNEDKKKDENPSADPLLRTSDKLLSTLFPFPDGGKLIKCFRMIRADSLLPLLALAMEDNLFARMAYRIPTNGNVTYWNCLRYAMDDVIYCNMACYSEQNESPSYERNLYESITNEANIDEGVHVIPPSDYPALTRCVLRMISKESSQNNHRSSMTSTNCVGWESLLLRLYHAAAVATSTLPKSLRNFQKKRNNSDYMATLATVESHVLVPSFSGASVSNLKSILDACALECCPSCKKNARLLEDKEKQIWSSGYSAPTWAVAGVVLSIMRARSSNIMKSSNSVGFGPRRVFRMASEILNRANFVDNMENSSSFDDEISYALRVLLSMPGISKGGCFSCTGNDGIRDTDRSAYELLKVSYYSSDSCFRQRYDVRAKHSTYRYQLGLETLSSYSRLIRCSLLQGAHELNAKTHNNTCVADTAKTWMEAALMLLDDERDDRDDGRGSKNEKRYSCGEGVAMAIVILVVVFCEVSSSQPTIVRHLLECVMNVTSRELYFFDKCNAEKFFVLISVLAWSLTEWTGKSTTPHVFQKENRDVTSTLDPLCGLLSKSRQNEMFANIESATLSYRTLHHLSRALSTVPSARDAILALAKKHMLLLSTDSSYAATTKRVRTFFESIPPNSSEHRDSVYFAIECLCILVQRRNLSDHWEPDECELEAVSILSDILVMQKPSSLAKNSSSALLSSEVSLWVCRRLENLASSSMLSKWSSSRLMRGCFMSLSGSYDSIRVVDDSHLGNSSRVTSQSMNDSVSFVPMIAFRARKDIRPLLSLSSSLFKFLADEEIQSKTWHEINARIHTALLAKSEPDYIAENDHDTCGHCYEVLRQDFYGDDTCDFTNDGILLAFFIEGAARHLKSQNLHQSRIDENAMNEIRISIIRNETRHYAESAPNWIDFTNIPNELCNTSRMQRDDDEAVNFSMSLCDFIVETILGGISPADDVESNSQNLDDYDGTLRVINYLLQIKRQAMNSVSPMISKRLSNSSSISRSAMCRFFNLSCRRLRLLLEKTENRMSFLPEVDLLLQNIIDFSKSTSFDSSDHSVNGERLLSSAIKLYSSTSDEKSSKLLISFVEGAYYDAGQWAQEDCIANKGLDPQSQFTLQQISSANFLDGRVRHLRSIVLSALSRELDNMTNSQPVLSPNDKIVIFDLLSKNLRVLCEDLGAGYLGHSGGMTRSLFLLYLGVISKCVGTLSNILDSLIVADNCRLKNVFGPLYDAMGSIWRALCDYNLKQSSMVKSTARLCFDQIPTLLRKVERGASTCIFNEHVHKFSILFIEFCINSFLDIPPGNVAETAAYGPIMTDHDVADANKQQTREISREDFQLQQICENPVEGSNVSRNFKKPSVCSPDQLPAVLNIALSGMAKTYHESYKLISSVGDRRQITKKHSKECITLALRRRVELTDFLSAMYKLFEDDLMSSSTENVRGKKEIEPNDDAREDNGVKDIVASRLSFHGMANFCACLEKIAMTLVASVKRLIKYFNHFKHSFHSVDEEHRLVESMVCIIAWICSRNRSKHDISTGTMHWYIIQREKFSSAGGDDNYPILGRLPKVIYRLDHFEAELLNLINILLGDISHVEDDAKRRKMRWFESITTALSQNTPGSDVAFDFVASLKDCVSDIDAKKRGMKFETNEEDSDSSSDSNDNVFMTNIRRKRRIGSKSRRPRRYVLRSRNETIDDWLAMDDDEFGSEPGERYNVDDAFVDLEDFLVEG